MSKRPKYGNRKVTRNGITFDSKREADRWDQLKLLERAGEITNLDRQVPFDLMGRDGPILTPTGRQMRYFADAVYIDWGLKGAKVVEDTKGFPTPEYKIKKSILAAQGVTIVEV